jgi:hypothetical protein
MLQLIDVPNPAHACSDVVGAQVGIPGYLTHQAPEPWNGNLHAAKILFISSNPSISQLEQYPNIDATDHHLIQFFTQRFGVFPESPIESGRRVLNIDGSRSRAVPFLSWVRCRVAELLQIAADQVNPGIDYALTEVVHCKSLGELGVQRASEHCGDHFLKRILNCSGAAIFVFVGDRAAEMADHLFGINPGERIQGPRALLGLQRMMAFLPHPNSHKPCKFVNVCEPNDVRQIRQFLASA